MHGSGEGDHSATSEDVADPLLYSVEAHRPARLALEMVDDSSQGLEVCEARKVRAVVELLLVCHKHERRSAYVLHLVLAVYLRAAEFRCWLRPDRDENCLWHR